MLTLKEKLEALVRGEKLGSTIWPNKDYIWLDDEELRNENGVLQFSRTICEATHIHQLETLDLGPEDVGKRVKLRNGFVTLILGAHANHINFMYYNDYIRVDSAGKHANSKSMDIVEVLE